MVSSVKRYNGHRILEEGKDSRIPHLIRDLESPHPATREKARHALVAVGQPAVPSLIPLLSHAKVHVRWEAAKALSDIACPIAATSLVSALEDEDGDIRWVASEGLINLGAEGVQPLLTAMLERSQSAWFCQGAHHVCHALIKKKRLTTILRPVLAALEEAHRAIAMPLAAYAALWKLREMSGKISNSLGYRNRTSEVVPTSG